MARDKEAEATERLGEVIADGISAIGHDLEEIATKKVRISPRALAVGTALGTTGTIVGYLGIQAIRERRKQS